MPLAVALRVGTDIDHGLLFLAPDGRAIQIPAWVLNRVLLPVVVRWGFYRGIRRA